jgi:hypothetical protein
MDVNAAALLKAPAPIVVTFVEIVRLARLVVSENANGSIKVTPFGIAIPVRWFAPAKAPAPIEVNNDPGPKVIVSSEVAPAKANAPIEVSMLSGPKVIDVIDVAS